MKLTGNSYVLIVIMAIMLFVIVWALVGMKFFASKLLPLVVGGTVLALAAVGLWRETKTVSAPKAPVTRERTDIGQAARETWRGYLLNVAWVAGFTIGIVLLGFIPTIPIFLLGYMKWLGTRWRTAIIYAVLTPVLVHYIFERLLRIDLYQGLLLRWLG